MTTLADSPADAPRDGQVALAASRIARQGETFADIRTFIGAKPSGGSGYTGGTGGNSVPAATTLDSYFLVTAASGDYKLDTPVEIGRLDGKPVTLVVGKPTK